VGDYRDEHLFTLRQSLLAYRHYQQLIAEVDEKVKHLLSELPAQVDPAKDPIPKARNPPKSLGETNRSASGRISTALSGSISLRCRALTR